MAVSAYGTETTINVGGLLEKVTRSGVTEYRHLIMGGKGVAAIYTRRTSGSPLTDTFYVHSDHLGSPELITNAAGAEVVKLSFGAYGERRDSDWDGAVTSGDMTTIGNTTRHGFTGHEHLDSVNLIHMNGRVYDPVVGRFLSADPFIDWGLGTQGANRYGYVGNNPLSFTDPSGYTCTPNLYLSDEEQAAEMTRCADEDDGRGWGLGSERWCAMLDFNCQRANWEQTQASLVDALLYAGIPPPRPGTTGISNADVSNAPGDELVVTASRLRNGDEDMRWARHLGVPTSAFLISATLPNGDRGWVTIVAMPGSSQNVGPVPESSVNGQRPTLGQSMALLGFGATANEYFASAAGLARLGPVSGAVGAIFGGVGALDAYSRGDYLGGSLSLAVAGAGFLLTTGVISVSTPVWGAVAIGTVTVYTVGSAAYALRGGTLIVSI